jgi:GAF domain-containing protein
MPLDEPHRLAALHAYDVLDTEPDVALDRIVALAARLTASPISLLSFVDSERQWFKARHGVAATETPRAFAFCAHTILDPSRALSVPDARSDRRFSHNPLVRERGGIRAYLGVPLTSPCTAPGFLDTRLHYAARLRLVSRCAARASRGLR